MRLRTLATHLGITFPRAKRLCRETGVSLRKRKNRSLPYNSRAYRRLTPDEVLKVAALYYREEGAKAEKRTNALARQKKTRDTEPPLQAE